MSGFTSRAGARRRRELSFATPKQHKRQLSYAQQVPRAIAGNLGLFFMLLAGAIWYGSQTEMTTAPPSHTQTAALSTTDPTAEQPHSR